MHRRRSVSPKVPLAIAAVPLLLTGAWALNVGQDQPVGYDDTPVIPGQGWRVHDSRRPQPRVVTPGAQAHQAPSDATVLFDGSNLDGWTGRGGKAQWKLVDGAMEVNGTGKITTKEQFGDCQLHIEWRSPEVPVSNSQGRGNSGIFLMDRYEVQVLDSFDNPSYPDGQAGSMYGQWPPRVNASRGPGEWQTYDILFEAPHFTESGELFEPAYLTLIHNGVVVHHRQPYLGATTHKRVAKYGSHPSKGPIGLQDHSNPVQFRNIWVRELGEYDGGAAAPGE